MLDGAIDVGAGIAIAALHQLAGSFGHLLTPSDWREAPAWKRLVVVALILESALLTYFAFHVGRVVVHVLGDELLWVLGVLLLPLGVFAIGVAMALAALTLASAGGLIGRQEAAPLKAAVYGLVALGPVWLVLAGPGPAADPFNLSPPQVSDDELRQRVAQAERAQAVARQRSDPLIGSAPPFSAVVGRWTGSISHRGRAVRATSRFWASTVDGGSALAWYTANFGPAFSLVQSQGADPGETVLTGSDGSVEVAIFVRPLKARLITGGEHLDPLPQGTTAVVTVLVIYDSPGGPATPPATAADPESPA